MSRRNDVSSAADLSNTLSVLIVVAQQVQYRVTGASARGTITTTGWEY